MASYTANYKLHQWEPEDNFLRTDFNEDFQKIDTALQGLESKKADTTTLNSKISTVTSRLSTQESRTYYVVGTFDGNGAASRDISLGFAPKAVFVEHNYGNRTINGVTYGGLAVTGSPLISNGQTAMELTTNGFRVYSTSPTPQLNQNKVRYNYIAFK